MAKHVLLNNIEHKDIKIITRRAEQYGDNLWSGQLLPSEYRAAQASYPIFFQKFSDTGKFSSVALFGFEKNENLFLDENDWNAPYIPMMIYREPFMIGTQRYQEDGQEKTRRVIHLDMDSHRVSTTEGEPLFKEFGGNTPYLERIASCLDAIHHALPKVDIFVNALIKNDLLEPFTLSITLIDGSQNELLGFYTINEDKLKKLSTEAIADLHRSGHLESIYMILASHSRIHYLIEQKNKKLLQSSVN